MWADGNMEKQDFPRLSWLPVQASGQFVYDV